MIWYQSYSITICQAKKEYLSLPNDANISANDYVHVEDENNWTILTDEISKLGGDE